MDFDQLRNRACASLALLLPQAEGVERLVDECLASARLAFRDDFILQISPEAWARISLIYITTFLDQEVDVSMGEIVAEVVRDSVGLNRMGPLAQQVAQRKACSDALRRRPRPALHVVRGGE